MSQQSDAKKSKAVLGRHVKELVGHTLDSAAYGSHGHAAGEQGRAGHEMPPNDAHLQGGAYVPQNMYTSRRGGKQQADNAHRQDCATVDKFDE